MKIEHFSNRWHLMMSVDEMQVLNKKLEMYLDEFNRGFASEDAGLALELPEDTEVIGGS